MAAAADATLLELLGQRVGTVLGAAEHDGRAGGVDDLGGEVDALGAVDRPEVVRGRELVGLGELVTRGVVLVATDELVDRAVERGREQQRLARLRRLVEQRLDRGQEAHVGHAVGFVDDDHLDLVEVDLAALDQVGETTRAGDEHVDAAPQRLELRAEPGAAVDGRDAQLASRRRATRAHRTPGRRAHGWARARVHAGAWGAPCRRGRRAGCRTRSSCPSRWGRDRRGLVPRGRRAGSWPGCRTRRRDRARGGCGRAPRARRDRRRWWCWTWLLASPVDSCCRYGFREG